MNALPRKIYLVDDDESVRDSLRVLLESHGVAVEDFGSAEDFLNGMERQGREDDCLLLDMHMPGMDGLQLLEAMKARGTAMPSVMITGRGDDLLANRAKIAGADVFLHKPVGEDELLRSIKIASAHRGGDACGFAAQ